MPYQLKIANQCPHIPVLAHTPKINKTKINKTQYNSPNSSKIVDLSVPVEDAPCAPRSPHAFWPESVLNPLAHEFIPFALLLPEYDEVDEGLDHSEAPYLDDPDSSGALRVEDLLAEEVLWSHFHESDDTAEPLRDCDCHQLPRGSCPKITKFQVDHIFRALQQTDLVPNMDGLREPLAFPSFPTDVWKWALEGYFDGDKLYKGMIYGWDMSFMEEPKPRNAKWNLQGASIFERDVQAYVDQELKFGALVGPFEEAELPYPVYCSPLNTAPKKNSDTRRTVVDCSQLGAGINAFIDPHWHRGKCWKLTLSNSQTIIDLIIRTRLQYPGQRVLIFKLDFLRYYRWFILDPVAAIYFAIRWRGKIFLDTALSFGNCGAALAAQRVI